MRRCIPVLLVLLPLCNATAQTQERKLMDRLLKPDFSQANPIGTKSYEAANGVALRQSSAAGITYSDAKGYATADFPWTRSFFGIKNPWFGEKVYDTSAMKAGSFWSSDKSFQTAEAPARGYFQSDKSAPLGKSIVPLGTFDAKGNTQGAMDEITTKISKKEMTIDEVRELLNKNQ